MKRSTIERLARHGAAFAFFVFIAAAMTYPTVRHLRTELPGEWRDQYQRVCDVQLMSWVLDWDARRILTWDWAGYWDGNIFHPARGVLAYSEHSLGAALLGAPVYTVTRDPVLLYNTVFLLSFALCGYAAALLVLDVTGRWGPAIVAGLAFGFCPFRFGHLIHLHLLMAFWAPIALLCGRRFLAERSWPWLAGLSGALVLQLWTSLTLGVFLLVVLALVGMPAAWIAWRTSPRRLLPAMAITALVLLGTQAPIAISYWRIHREAGFARTWQENVSDSADVVGYAAAPASNRWLGRITSRLTKAERWLYPGIVTGLLAWFGIRERQLSRERKARLRRKVTYFLVIAGGLLVLVILSGRASTFFSWSLLVKTSVVVVLAWTLCLKLEPGRFLRRDRADARAFFVAWTLVAAALSFGPIVTVANRHIVYGPYALFFSTVPGFTGLRAPVRFHVYVMLGLAVLAGYGVKRLVDAYPRRAKLIVAVAGALILLDSGSLPLPSERLSELRTSLPLEQWLLEQPDEIVFAELPMVPNNELWRECQHVFSSIYHRKRIVNGYSGFFPQEWHWLRLEVLRSGVTEAALDYLHRAGVTHVALPGGTPAPPRLTPVRNLGSRVVYELR